jgi:hypothetical protein
MYIKYILHILNELNLEPNIYTTFFFALLLTKVHNRVISFASCRIVEGSTTPPILLATKWGIYLLSVFASRLYPWILGLLLSNITDCKLAIS